MLDIVCDLRLGRVVWVDEDFAFVSRKRRQQRDRAMLGRWVNSHVVVNEYRDVVKVATAELVTGEIADESPVYYWTEVVSLPLTVSGFNQCNNGYEQAYSIHSSWTWERSIENGLLKPHDIHARQSS